MVSFLAEEGLVKLSLNTTRQKTRNLMARPQATLLIPDPASPNRTLEIRGDVEPTPDDDYSFAGTSAASMAAPTSATPTAQASPGVGVVLRPVRLNVTDLRSLSGS